MLFIEKVTCSKYKVRRLFEDYDFLCFMTYISCQRVVLFHNTRPNDSRFNDAGFTQKLSLSLKRGSTLHCTEKLKGPSR